MATKKRYTPRILLVNPEGLNEQQRETLIAKYQSSHKVKVEFLGEYEFEHTEEFNFEYASTLCNTGVPLYAKLHGYEIPDTIWTRGGVGRKLDALKALVGAPEKIEPSEEDLLENKSIESTQMIENETSKEPSKEDFVDLINGESSEGEKAPESSPVEPEVIAEPKEEGEKELKVELEDKSIKEPIEETKVDVPENLKCPHCGATARTEKSYIKNHGDNCARKIETK